MSLQQIKKLNDQKGFTIVELLIVIVVIGILAAIVIVAYIGVTNKAKDSNNRSDAVSIAKVAEALNADSACTGYPTGTTTSILLNGTTGPVNTSSSFACSSTTKLPTAVTVTYVSATPTDAAAAITLADATTHNYQVKVCAVSPNTTGLVIYYPKRDGGASIQAQTVGAGC